MIELQNLVLNWIIFIGLLISGTILVLLTIFHPTRDRRRIYEIDKIIFRYAARFQGITIDFRRHQPGWPKPWRLMRFASKNERDEYRLTEYFDSFPELIQYIKENENDRGYE